MFKTTKARTPAELLVEADRFLEPFRDKLLPYVWRTADRAEHLQRDGAEERQAFVAEMQKALGGHHGKIREYLVPVGVGLMGGALTVASDGVTDLVQSSLEALAKILLANQTLVPGKSTIGTAVGAGFSVGQWLWDHRHKTYLDQYRDLNQLLLTANRSSSLNDQVQQVFGCPLTA